MLSTQYISDVANSLVRKYNTRNPYKICDELGIRIRYKDLGMDIKAYYFYQSRIRSIVINSRVSESVRRILVAHELGHDRLHREIAMMRGFQEIELFSAALPAEYEANIFAAELLIGDDELIELFNDRDASFFGIARELCVPSDLLDFKFRVLKNKGYRIEAPYTARGDFLKDDIADCYEEDGY